MMFDGFLGIPVVFTDEMPKPVKPMIFAPLVERIPVKLKKQVDGSWVGTLVSTKKESGEVESTTTP